MSYTKEDLNEKTVANLRAICRDLEITGMSKKRKDVIIDAIINNDVQEEEVVIVPTNAFSDKPLTSLTGSFQSTQKPGSKKIDTVIRISCGASSGDFDVAGRSVGSVAVFLKSILNIPTMSKGIVDGKEVADKHVLTAGETLEFIKPAGDKGNS